MWHEAISAIADGEDPGVEPRLVAAHLERCAACRQFEQSIDGSRRRGVVGVATPMPDLSRRVSKLVALADRAGAWSVVRVLLLVVAVQVIAFSVPALVLGHGDTGVHEARHLGAFSVAYGVALVVVAVRPARARTILPVSVVLAGALTITAVIDLLEGHVPLLSEAVHLPELASVVLVWLLAVPSPRRRSSERPSHLGLRVVPDEPGDGEGRSVG